MTDDEVANFVKWCKVINKNIRIDGNGHALLDARDLGDFQYW